MSTETSSNSDKITNLTHETEKISLGTTVSTQINSTNDPKKENTARVVSGLEVSNPVDEVSEFKAMAADASVFTFGDDEDYESD